MKNKIKFIAAGCAALMAVSAVTVISDDIFSNIDFLAITASAEGEDTGTGGSGGGGTTEETEPTTPAAKTNITVTVEIDGSGLTAESTQSDVEGKVNVTGADSLTKGTDYKVTVTEDNGKFTATFELTTSGAEKYTLTGGTTTATWTKPTASSGSEDESTPSGSESESTPAATPAATTPAPAPAATVTTTAAPVVIQQAPPAAPANIVREVSSSPDAAVKAIENVKSTGKLTLSGKAADEGVSSEIASAVYGKSNVKISVQKSTVKYTVKSRNLSSKDAVIDIKPEISVSKKSGTATIKLDGEMKDVTKVTSQFKIKEFAGKEIAIYVNGKKVRSTFATAFGWFAVDITPEMMDGEITVKLV